MVFATFVRSHMLVKFWFLVTECPPVGKIAAHSANDMISRKVPNW